MTLLMLLAASPALADSASTNTDNGFARIFFRLDPVAHARTELVGGVLTVTFDRKVAIAATAIEQGLAAYVGSVREEADGETFRIALSQSVRLHTSTSGNNFVVDLAPETFSGTPPDLPPPPSKDRPAVDVAKLPALQIHAGAYSDFTRLVFEWPKNVPYAVFPGAGHITVRFEALARPDFTAIVHVAPPWVKETGWRVEDKGTVIDFETDADSKYHDFRSGQKIVLDILAPKADMAAYNPPGETGNSGEKPKPVKLAGATANAAAPSAQEKAVIDAAKALNPQAASAATPPAPAKAAADAASTQTTVPPAPSAAVIASSASASAPAAAQPAASSTTDPNGALAQRTRDGAVINFAGAGARPAAVFVRGMTAWIVLDGASAIDSARLKTALGDFPATVDASSGGGFDVLRIGLKQQEKIAARAEGSNLKVTISPNVSAMAEAIGFVRNDDPKHAALSTLVPGAMHQVILGDPAAGDQLVVIPAALGRATLTPHVYAEFAALPTAAGLAITPFTDNLDVRVADSRITISRPQGLALAPASLPAIDTPAGLARDVGGPCYLDFANWSRSTNGTFLAAQRRLRTNTAAAKPGDAGHARLALARFHLANGFAAEALGLINLMEAADPELQGDQQMQTMRAAAEYMMGRYRDAHNDLAGSGFDNDRHVAFWRGLTEAAMFNWDGARKALAQAEPVIHRYPADWQARARIAAAQASLAAGAIEAADAEMARLPQTLSKSLMLEAQLARAQLYAQESRNTEATSLFKAIENSGDERLAARAIFAEVVASLASGAMSQNAAIETLEGLRFRWRGDALELETLRKLGALYFGKHRWREGLGILRLASQNFVQDDLARQAQDDMRETFETLFLKGKADAMPPIEALALFYDFIDLTPIGPNGDEMIRRMADRLVAVDLLEPAAKLLNYQVTKRLDGVARAQVATRLAMIDLMDHHPKEALEALRTTQITGLPDDLNHARTLLQARALAALKQWDQATDMIAADETSDARQLRADIYWESGNWDVAAQKAEELVSATAGETKMLSTDDRQEVMRAAIAYSLAGDEAGLGHLRTRFSDKMRSSPEASAFAVVTQKLDTQGTAFRDMAGQIASIDTLEAFMQDFRKHYDVGRMTN